MNKRIETALTRLVIAIQFLTIIIPVKIKKNYDSQDVIHSIIYFPFVGFMLGIVGAGINIAINNKIPVFMKDILILIVLTALTGGIHLTGFVDIIDDLLNEKKEHDVARAIKGHSLTEFGTIIFSILLMLKFLLFYSINEDFKNIILVIFPMLSRWAMVIAIFMSEKNNNTSGREISYSDLIDKNELFIVGIIPVIITILFVKFQVFILAGAIFFITSIFVYYSHKRNFMIKRDIFGAINEITEFAVILFFSISQK